MNEYILCVAMGNASLEFLTLKKIIIMNSTLHILQVINFLIRAVVPKQVDYLNEVKEFEAEMRKHSHKFPHDILSYNVHVVLG